MIKILIACECSQVVCKAFRKEGFEAYSNDIIPCYGGHPEWHIIGDAEKVIRGKGIYKTESGALVNVTGFWAMIIAHPPCTMLTHSSAVAFAQGKHSLMDIREGALFFMKMLSAPAKYVAVENPAPMKIAQLPPYDYIVNPYDFGHIYSKRVCLWLRNLPPLLPTHAHIINHKQWLNHCASNSKRRSKTFEGIAQAMAEQWGGIIKKDATLQAL